MIKFILLVNKQGETRLSQYYKYVYTNTSATVKRIMLKFLDQPV